MGMHGGRLESVRERFCSGRESCVSSRTFLQYIHVKAHSAGAGMLGNNIEGPSFREGSIGEDKDLICMSFERTILGRESLTRDSLPDFA